MSRRIIAVLISVVLAAVGAGAVLLYIRSADSRAVAGKQARSVLVAGRQISAGTSGHALKNNSALRPVRMPAETVPDDALANIGADLDGLVTTAAVQRGQLLLRSMFGTAVANGSGQVIPEGKMLVPVVFKGIGAAAVQAGSRIVIFVTYTADKNDPTTMSPGGLDRSKGANVITLTLMTDVQVMSVGSGTGSDAIGRTSTAGAAREDLPVTLALTQKQALTLAQVVEVGGVLNLAVRGDSSKVEPDQSVTNTEIFGQP
jgi:pilus assembly protein CpaB